MKPFKTKISLALTLSLLSIGCGGKKKSGSKETPPTEEPSNVVSGTQPDVVSVN